MRYRVAISVFSIMIVVLLANILPAPSLNAAVTILDPNGYKGLPYKYTPTVQTPTGEKPQSKLWYNDGRWWGDLFNTSDGKYHIYWLDLVTQTWKDTGTILDPRTQTKADCLWDGTHLYVASGGGGADSSGSGTPAALPANLYRYSYNPITHVYSLDTGFPVPIRDDGAESIVLDKDSTGMLWITYTQNNKVYVNHSRTSDADWIPAAAAQLSVAGTNSNVSPDDISTLVAADGKIVVFWSNESAGQFSGSTDTAFYFAAHTDGTADTNWAGGFALKQPKIADDHMNIKSLQADASGNIFAMVKTSLNTIGDAQLLLLVAKKTAGSYSWNAYIESIREEAQTRPILLVDTDHRQLYVFTSDESGRSVYYKTTSLDNIRFNTGSNSKVQFMSKPGFAINNVTSTKQTVNTASGIVVLASHDNGTSVDTAQADYYFHNYINLGGAVPTPLSTVSPTTTPTPVAQPPTITPTIVPGELPKPRVYVTIIVR